MYLIRSLTIISIFLLVSCGEGPKKNLKSETELPIEGFWERKGTIQFVNGVPVDTLLYGVDEEGMRNFKVYSEGNVFWVNDRNNGKQVWKGGNGGYGKFKINDSILTEYMSHGTGGMGAYLHYSKDSLNVPSMQFDFNYSLSDMNYVQLGGAVPDSEDNISFGEYYERLTPKKKSKMDGSWKRAYEIFYVNGVAVDTTKVPTDALLDVKIIKDGYFIIQVDQTKLINDPSNPEYYGGGSFGQHVYDGNGNMVEYFEFGSGQGEFACTPRNVECAHFATVSFYDDDMFLQITKDTLSQGNAGRGVVYQRIE